ncbi:Uncharacterized protein PBTT_02095 [Plasmodiophora brassicae]
MVVQDGASPPRQVGDDREHDRMTAAVDSEQAQAARKILTWWRRIRHALRVRRDESRQAAALQVTDQLIEEFLNGDIIPDLLISVIRGSSQRFAPYSEDVLTSKEVLDGILFEVVDECLRGVVADLIGRLVGGYLHECSQARANDVFTAAVDAIIADVCDDALPGIVRQVVQSMVDEYLALVDDMAKVEILMAPMVDEICDDIAEEVLVKHTVDGLVDQWADELTERVCRSTWERVQKQTAADHKVVEAQIIRKHSSTLLDKSILKILLTNLATRNESATINMHVQRLLDKMILDRVVRLHVDLHDNAQQVGENLALSTFHQVVTAQASVDVLVHVLRSELRRPP